MPFVRKRIEKLFPQDEFYDSQSSLLNTIRVPKNLLYLTDRLPKPSYESPQQYRKKLEEEERRRKTHDAGNMLPELKNQQQQIPKKPKNIVNTSVDTATSVAGQQKETAGKKSRKSNGGVPGKQVRGRSDLRGGPTAEESPENLYNPPAHDEATAKVATAASNHDEDRGSVVSMGSMGNQKTPLVPMSQRDQPPINRKNTNKRAPISHRAKEPVVMQHHSVDNQDEYEEDQFEREEGIQGKSYSPPPKAHLEDKDSLNEGGNSPLYYQ